MGRIDAEVLKHILKYRDYNIDYTDDELSQHTTNVSNPHSVTFAQITAVVGAKTSSYTATLNDNILLCDATNGNITIILPQASTASGKLYYIKKTDISGNDIIIDGYGDETVDDETTQTFDTQYLCLTIVCDETEWWII